MGKRTGLRKFTLFLKIAVAVLLLGWLAWQVDWKTIETSAESLRWEWILLAIVLGHLDRILMAWKWRDLILSQGHSVISLKDALVNTYMGNFAGQFLPAGVGGDLVRVFLLRRINLPLTATVASIIVERVFGMYALIAVSGLAMGISSSIGVRLPAGLTGWISAAFCLGTISILLSFSPMLRKCLENMSQSFQRSAVFKKILDLLHAYNWYGGHKSVLSRFYLLSLVEVCLTTMVIAAAAKAIQIQIHILQFLVIVPLVLFLQRIPVSINGLGIQEGLFVFFLGLLGESIETTFAFGILLRILQIFILAPGGIFYLRVKKIELSEANF